jgi:carbon storage regulator CsrA
MPITVSEMGTTTLPRWHERCVSRATRERRTIEAAWAIETRALEVLTEERTMLVLSRKLGQSFHIGRDVRVTIVKIDRNAVRIGVHAPDEVGVQREEIAFELPEPRSRTFGAGAA